MDIDKRKITAYINEDTYQNMTNYISLNYTSSYGATSNTVDNALNHYLWTEASIKPEFSGRSEIMWAIIQDNLKEVKNEDV